MTFETSGKGIDLLLFFLCFIPESSFLTKCYLLDYEEFHFVIICQILVTCKGTLLMEMGLLYDYFGNFSTQGENIIFIRRGACEVRLNPHKVRLKWTSKQTSQLGGGGQGARWVSSHLWWGQGAGVRWAWARGQGPDCDQGARQGVGLRGRGCTARWVPNSRQRAPPARTWDGTVCTLQEETWEQSLGTPRNDMGPVTGSIMGWQGGTPLVNKLMPVKTVPSHHTTYTGSNKIWKTCKQWTPSGYSVTWNKH